METSTLPDRRAMAGDDETGASGAERDLAGLRRITLAAIALAAVVFAYYVVADRTTPFTSGARVQAFIVRMAPEVAGQVLSVDVIDNSRVARGDTLFRLDPTPFQIAVEQAQAKLAQVGQSIGASTAAVDSAQAMLDEARAAEANTRAQTARTFELVKRGVYASARQDQATAALDEALARVVRAEAELARAREQLGPAGDGNPQVQEAIATLDKARFDLSKTTVTAPSDGVVTNLQLAGGQVVTAGQPAMTFISVTDVWLLAPMRENSLGVLASGQRAEVVLDVLPGRVFEATVSSLGWGIASGSADPATGLPKSPNETGWLTSREQFPVQLAFDADNLPRGARYGSKAAVLVYSGDNAVMNAIGWLRMRLIAILTYVS
ncbi:transporter [Skermanella stibiiresistens SB22]|uniref:Transporter n=1 Tax=Skermanella stibiiresistens SB22 TaxID=1385369 RepID=W9H024_9PROT|nr:HlyD family secretion protein [Skermanella stibiiresistens]EWY39419.1 transporter [Skermanella stibiiresistens SB22]